MLDASPEGNALDVGTIRNDFTILSSTVHGKPLVYLDNAATTQKPECVLERIVEFHRESNGNAHRGGHHLSERATGLYEGARETVARFLGAYDPREVVFTQGTTDAINQVAWGWARDVVGEGDEILVTGMEHHSNLVPWQELCRQTGAVLRAIPFADDGTLRPDAVDDLLTERTRLLALPHVSNVLGLENPVREVVERAHAREVPVLVDAAQSVPHLPIDVQELGCDFLAFSGHKMYATTGIGVLWAGAERLERMRPSRFGGGMIERVDWDRTTFAEPPWRFEGGTPDVAAAVGLATAVRYVERLGRESILHHEERLVRHAQERLASVEGLRVLGTGARKCPVFSFVLEGTDPYDVAMILDKLGVAVRAGAHCSEPLMRRYGIAGTVRASFALYNTTGEIDVLVEALNRAGSMLR